MLCAALTASATAAAADPTAEQASVLGWGALQRLAELTSDTWWLTLAGLFWLKEGDNSFGSGPGNDLILDNAALAKTAGTFQVGGNRVRFLAQPRAEARPTGTAVDPIALHSDAGSETMVLGKRFAALLRDRARRQAGRAGRVTSRIRAAWSFHGLQYFPISDKAGRERALRRLPAR